MEGSVAENLIWTSSGDSHSIEPPNLYKDNLPAHYAERMPRSEWVPTSR
jgi:hypothetical protein